MNRAEIAIVGGGIVGLAHAWAAARRGHSVVLFDRDRKPHGASVRNFGMIWPIGQTAGILHQRALHSRQLWLELARAAGFWVNPCGSLHLAHQADELLVLEEFADQAPALGFDCSLLSPAEAVRRYPAVRSESLLGALWSPTELCVDPRQVLSAMPSYLKETYKIDICYGSTVASVELPRVTTAAGQTWEVQRVLVCSGVDFQTLYPEVFAASGIVRCKLQMLRTVPQPGGWRLGTHLASGLTLCHYPTFQVCPTLSKLKQRIREQMPDYVRYGIHVLAAQNELGEVIIGDSHEYGDDIEPFDKAAIDELILGYVRRMVRLPEWTIAGRWHGYYAKHPAQPLVTAEPEPGVHIISASGGAGMTMSFANAENWWATIEDSHPRTRAVSV